MGASYKTFPLTRLIRIFRPLGPVVESGQRFHIQKLQNSHSFPFLCKRSSAFHFRRENLKPSPKFSYRQSKDKRNPHRSMGCVSSKLFRNDVKREIIVNNGGHFPNHVVSLTSSTYGALKLDREKIDKESVAESEAPEVINAWELMEGLEEETQSLNAPTKKSPNARLLLRGFGDVDSRTPLKFLNQIGSPRKGKKSGGKENRGGGIVRGLFGYSPKEILQSNKISSNSRNDGLNLSFSVKGSPVFRKRESFGSDHSGFSFRRRSLTPLFDPELVESYERELSEEGEQIKRMILETPKSRTSPKLSLNSFSILQAFEKKCPPGGETSVVIYTTTLRGIRKTFEDCNMVRTIIESHQIQMFERDVSMDSGFKEELRALLPTKEVKVPLVFIKGRLIGGANEVVKLEEEGKLAILFEDIPIALGGCEGCGGVRFVLCMYCNGSCKILDVGKKTTNKCGNCNENGLIQCPICC